MNTRETYKLHITNYARTILIHTHATKIDFMSIQFTNSGLKITLKKVTKGIMFKDLIKGNKIHLITNFISLLFPAFLNNILDFSDIDVVVKNKAKKRAYKYINEITTNK